MFWHGIVSAVDGFTPVRARLYLLALTVWWADLVLLVFHSSGSHRVTTPLDAAQLASMFVSCGVICGMAWLMTRDADCPYAAVRVMRPDDHVRFAMVVMRFWLMMLGGGALSALRVLR